MVKETNTTPEATFQGHIFSGIRTKNPPGFHPSVLYALKVHVPLAVYNTTPCPARRPPPGTCHASRKPNSLKCGRPLTVPSPTNKPGRRLFQQAERPRRYLWEEPSSEAPSRLPPSLLPSLRPAAALGYSPPRVSLPENYDCSHCPFGGSQPQSASLLPVQGSPALPSLPQAQPAQRPQGNASTSQSVTHQRRPS